MSTIKKILILAANPSDRAQLRLGEEFREIEEGLRRSKNREQFIIEKRSAVRFIDLRRALLDCNPNIVHFCGHGETEGIMFEDVNGETALVGSDILSRLFELFVERGVECVVLNACYTEPLANEISKHIGYVIGMSKAIEDKTAIDFAVGFYDGLGAGMSVDDAYRLSCVSFPANLTPVLKKKSDYIISQTVGIQEDELPAFVVGSPIMHPRSFFGRERELKRLFNLFKYIPLQNAAIIGPRRSGKTSLLQQLRNLTTISSEQLRIQQRLNWLPQPERYRWIFVDFQDTRLGNREGLLRYLLTELDLTMPIPCDLDHFLDLVSDNLRTPTIILLDEIGVALQRYRDELDDPFWEALRALATTQVNGNLGFVLAAHESPTQLAKHSDHSSPFFNIFGYTAMLGPLIESESRELIASSPIPFSDTDIEWILTQSGRWPILLQILCRERRVALDAGETDDSWKNEAIRQLEPFRHLLEFQGQL